MPTSAACAASYRLVGQWGGGFQGEVTVRAGTTAINGWQVGMTFPGGQTVTQVWGGTVSGTTVRNESWNGGLAAGATTTFGFIGSGAAATPALTCATG